LQPKPQPQEISERLRPWLADNSQTIPPIATNFFDGRDVALASLQLGLHGQMGLLVAGSSRSDFPQQTERLVLTVAANQAAIGLHEANLFSALDQRVAQRTAELAATNEELRKEITERKSVEEKLRHEESEPKRSEAYKAAILDSSLDCIVAMDHQGCITDAIRQLSGLSAMTARTSRESILPTSLSPRTSANRTVPVSPVTSPQASHDCSGAASK
jgi:PAS domain-containing protein